MSQFWIAPLLLVLLSLAWYGVQRAWLACMQQPGDSDALARPGQCGTSCACRGDCPRRDDRSPVEPSKEEASHEY
jgi:hypothetical protein